MPTIRAHSIAQRGLTLTELLIVIAILGGMATGVVPSVRLLMAHASAEDVSARIQTSWQLAIASAQAGERAVVWHADSDNASLRLAILDGQGTTLWSSRLAAPNAHLLCGTDNTPAQDVSLVVYPHGLSEPVWVEWEIDGSSHRIALQDLQPRLPTDTNDPPSNAAAE